MIRNKRAIARQHNIKDFYILYIRLLLLLSIIMAMPQLSLALLYFSFLLFLLHYSIKMLHQAVKSYCFEIILYLQGGVVLWRCGSECMFVLTVVFFLKVVMWKYCFDIEMKGSNKYVSRYFLFSIKLSHLVDRS